MRAAPPLVLVIAGLDQTGGAGLFSDIRGLSAASSRIAPVITAVTAQGSRGVTQIQCISPDIIAEQCRYLAEEYKISGIKIGMLGSAAIGRTIAGFLRTHPDIPVVLDPVGRASAGGDLAGKDLKSVIGDLLLPETTVVTPNRDELEWLSGISVATDTGLADAAALLLSTGTDYVLAKGGHCRGDPVDTLFSLDGKCAFKGTRLPGNIRGTGCHMAAFLAGRLAHGDPVAVAVEKSHDYIRSLFTEYAGPAVTVLPAWVPGPKGDFS